MITFQSNTPIPSPSSTLFPEFPEEQKSKIPFIFAAIPHKLFEYGLNPTTVGVYDGIARYVNWKSQMTPVCLPRQWRPESR